MTVKKLRYRPIDSSWMLIQVFTVPDDVVLVTMSTDTAFTETEKPTFEYQAGNIVNGKFDALWVWTSENGNLFDSL